MEQRLKTKEERLGVNYLKKKREGKKEGKEVNHNILGGLPEFATFSNK